MRSIALILFFVIAGSIAATAQSSFESADDRRLKFYSDKILVELHAIVDAQQAGNLALVAQHRRALETITTRWQGAAAKAGLAGDTADAFFRDFFAANYTGRIPTDYANDIGLISIASLRAGLTKPLPEISDNGELVNTLRSAGDDNALN